MHPRLLKLKDHRLQLAVDLDDIEMANAQLEVDADPDLILEKHDPITYGCYNEPLLFLVKSPEMMATLLKYGANPNKQSSYHQYSGEYNDLFYLVTTLLIRKEFNLLKSLAEHRPCQLNNKNINSGLTKYLKNNLDSLRAETFQWESIEGQAIVSLMHISTNLRESVIYDFGALNLPLKDNPFYYALNNNLKSALQNMLNHNPWLWEDLKSNPVSFILQPKEENEFNHLLAELEITHFFHIINIWLLIKTGINKKREFSRLPLELLVYIMKMAVDACNFNQLQLMHWQEYRKQNSELSEQMLTFGKIYTILRREEKNRFKNTFWNNNKHLKPLHFFSVAHQQGNTYPNGLTAETLKLIDENKDNLSGENETLVSCLTEYCTKDTILFFTTKEKITEDIRTELGMRKI